MLPPARLASATFRARSTRGALGFWPGGRLGGRPTGAGVYDDAVGVNGIREYNGGRPMPSAPAGAGGRAAGGTLGTCIRVGCSGSAGRAGGCAAAPIDGGMPAGGCPDAAGTAGAVVGTLAGAPDSFDSGASVSMGT